MAISKRPAAIVFATVIAAGISISWGFAFVPIATGRARALASERRLPSQHKPCRAAAQGALSMRRGKNQMGRNGPGLTGMQRVLNTRERMKNFKDPCKVGFTWSLILMAMSTCKAIYDTVVALTCAGKGLQLHRAKHFMQTCKSLFSGDEGIDQALQNALFQLS